MNFPEQNLSNNLGRQEMYCFWCNIGQEDTLSKGHYFLRNIWHGWMGFLAQSSWSPFSTSLPSLLCTSVLPVFPGALWSSHVLLPLFLPVLSASWPRSQSPKCDGSRHSSREVQTASCLDTRATPHLFSHPVFGKGTAAMYCAGISKTFEHHCADHAMPFCLH